MSNYIDRLACQIWRESEGDGVPDRESMPLYRMYAVLALAKGESTTNRDVHDAWSAWMAGVRPEHHSLIPFEELKPHVQELDSLYRDAIHRATRTLQQDGAA